jgi:hypothetical protein
MNASIRSISAIASSARSLFGGHWAEDGYLRKFSRVAVGNRQFLEEIPRAIVGRRPATGAFRHPGEEAAAALDEALALGVNWEDQFKHRAVAAGIESLQAGGECPQFGEGRTVGEITPQKTEIAFEIGRKLGVVRSGGTVVRDSRLEIAKNGRKRIEKVKNAGVKVEDGGKASGGSTPWEKVLHLWRKGGWGIWKREQSVRNSVRYARELFRNNFFPA